MPGGGVCLDCETMEKRQLQQEQQVEAVNGSSSTAAAAAGEARVAFETLAEPRQSLEALEQQLQQQALQLQQQAAQLQQQAQQLQQREEQQLQREQQQLQREQQQLQREQQLERGEQQQTGQQHREKKKKQKKQKKQRQQQEDAGDASLLEEGDQEQQQWGGGSLSSRAGGGRVREEAPKRKDKREDKPKDMHTKKKTQDVDTVFDTLLPAVLVAITFKKQQKSFAPLHLDRPLSVLPISGVPLVTAALDSLTYTGATEIMVIIKPDEEGRQVKKLVDDFSSSCQQRMRRLHQQLQITCLEVPRSVEAVGDVLRELFRQNTPLRSEFLLMHASTFVRGSLKAAVQEHQQRVEQRSSSSSDPVLTQVFAVAAPGSPQRQAEDEYAYIIAAETQQLLERVALQKSSRRHLWLNQQLFSRVWSSSGDGAVSAFFTAAPLQGSSSSSGEEQQLQVRFDLIDTGIYICSPKVLEMFSTSFDYKHMSRDFIPDLLKGELGLDAVYVHSMELTDTDVQAPFAACCSNPRLYYFTCEQAITRWTYPLKTLSFVAAEQPQLRYKGHGTYQADSVCPGLRCMLGPCTALEGEILIGDDSHISHSFIGHSSSIGSHVLLENCILFEEVKVGDNCKLRDCILARGCAVEEGATLLSGCLLGPSVLVPAHTVLPPNTRLYSPTAAASAAAATATAATAAAAAPHNPRPHPRHATATAADAADATPAPAVSSEAAAAVPAEAAAAAVPGEAAAAVPGEAAAAVSSEAAAGAPSEAAAAAVPAEAREEVERSSGGGERRREVVVLGAAAAAGEAEDGVSGESQEFRRNDHGQGKGKEMLTDGPSSTAAVADIKGVAALLRAAAAAGAGRAAAAVLKEVTAPADSAATAQSNAAAAPAAPGIPYELKGWTPQKIASVSLGDGGVAASLPLPLPVYDDDSDSDDDEEASQASDSLESEEMESSSSSEEEEEEAAGGRSVVAAAVGSSSSSRKSRRESSSSSGKESAAAAGAAAAGEKEDEEDGFREEVETFALEGFNEPHLMKHKLLEVKSYRLACNRSNADVLQHAFRVFLLVSARHGGPPTKQRWMELLRSLKADLLLSPFSSSSSDEEHSQQFFRLWDTCLTFFLLPKVPCLPTAAAEEEERERSSSEWSDDEDGDETAAERHASRDRETASAKQPTTQRIKNDFYGAAAFCVLCEALYDLNLLNIDPSLLLWRKDKLAATAAAAAAEKQQRQVEGGDEEEMKRKVEEFLLHPRLTAFCEWIEQDKLEEEDEDSN